jgi:hypothetical protein
VGVKVVTEHGESHDYDIGDTWEVDHQGNLRVFDAANLEIAAHRDTTWDYVELTDDEPDET